MKSGSMWSMLDWKWIVGTVVAYFVYLMQSDRNESKAVADVIEDKLKILLSFLEKTKETLEKKEFTFLWNNGKYEVEKIFMENGFDGKKVKILKTRSSVLKDMMPSRFEFVRLERFRVRGYKQSYELFLSFFVEIGEDSEMVTESNIDLCIERLKELIDLVEVKRFNLLKLKEMLIDLICKKRISNETR